FIGIQVVSPDVFRGLPGGEPLNSIGSVYDRCIAERPGSIRGVVSAAAFRDIGTPADYLRTSDALVASGEGTAHGRDARIAETSRVTRSILWDDVEILGECSLDHCIVTDHVRLPARSVYRDTILTALPDGGVAASPLNRHV